jgi:hypothetical protein
VTYCKAIVSCMIAPASSIAVRHVPCVASPPLWPLVPRAGVRPQRRRFWPAAAVPGGSTWYDRSSQPRDAPNSGSTTDRGTRSRSPASYQS